VKIWLKVALNAVRLPTFEAIHGKSWSLRTTVVKDLRQRSMLTWFCACADSCVIFSTGPYIVLADNSICLNRSAIKVVQWIGKSGSWISNKKCGKNLLQTHCQWYPMGDVRTHSLRTDSRRIFKLGGGLDHVTRQGQKVKGQGHKVTRSRYVSAAITL